MVCATFENLYVDLMQDEDDGNTCNVVDDDFLAFFYYLSRLFFGYICTIERSVVD